MGLGLGLGSGSGLCIQSVSVRGIRRGVGPRFCSHMVSGYWSTGVGVIVMRMP